MNPVQCMLTLMEGALAKKNDQHKERLMLEYSLNSSCKMFPSTKHLVIIIAGVLALIAYSTVYTSGSPG